MLQTQRIKCCLLALALATPHLLRAQAQVLAPDTLSNDAVFGLTLNARGDEAFFVNSHKGREKLDLMTARRVAGRWQLPTLAPFSGRYRDIDPIFAPDGRRLFFNSNRPVQEGGAPKKEFDIWYVDRDANGDWRVPQHVGAPVSSDSVAEFYAMPARNGDLYFTANRRDGRGRNDIYVARWRRGAYQLPESLAGINTDASESNACISPDGRILLFFSDRAGGAGASDLYISYRERDQWTPPQSLGAKVNTADSEFCPSVSADGQRLYFSRTIRKDGAVLAENLYYIASRELPVDAKRWQRAFH